MNVTSTVGKLTKKQYELTKKQRLMVLGVIGIIVMLITVYITTSDVEVAVETNPPITNTQGTGKNISKPRDQDSPVIQAAQITRDPFAAPPHLQEKSNVTADVPPIPNYGPGMVPKGVAPDISFGNLKLTGIVGANGRNLAVIMSGNNSKSYSLNDSIGPYKVIAITNDYVILANADSKLVLRMETSVQKGGNNSEK